MNKEQSNTGKIIEKKIATQQIINAKFQSIIDSSHLEGSILIYNLKDDTYHSNNYEWANIGHLPASTFKIANSIIGLETGAIKNENELFKWDGQPKAVKRWEQDLDLKDAFHYSCVPCYQALARKIGVKKMQQFVQKLNYGQLVIDTSNIDLFWLQGASKINQFEQINFLKRFYQSRLPISSRTEKIMKELMVIEETKQYTIIGKTGWSITNDKDNGWFVGYVKSKDNVHFFATNIEPRSSFNGVNFAKTRKEITLKALKTMQILN